MDISSGALSCTDLRQIRTFAAQRACECSEIEQIRHWQNRYS